MRTRASNCSGGELVEIAAIGSHHAACVRRLTRLFSQSLGDRALVWVQNPVRLDDFSEPEPDVALLCPRADYYEHAHPTPADVFLAVEVGDTGDTTAVSDAESKLPLYADAGVVEVWLVNLHSRRVEVCRRPEDGAYIERVRCGRGDPVAPGAFPDLVIDIASILPPTG